MSTIYIVYVPQINSYDDLLDNDLPVSWHSTKAGAEAMLAKQREMLLKDHPDIQITGREEEDGQAILSEHCYVLESELSE